MTAPEPGRVRFAPSPTGLLHIGTARTALFNWLHARGTGARFVLRIEDTDAERSTREFEASLLEDLRWLGIDWDEGVEAGGPAGSYRQSERLEAYREAAAGLLARGAAYRCFCTPAELEAERARAKAEGRPPRYSGRCNDLEPADQERRAREGEPAAIRLRVRQAGILTVEDRIKGPVEFALADVEDFVLVRSSGVASYVFAVVIDDLAMGITLVVRGEDLLPSTPRQLLVYRALGAAPPAFAHLPMVLGPDHAKLSKRHGAVSIGEYRAQGFLPEAVVNAVALLGWAPPEGREVLGRDDLVHLFRLDRVGRSNAIFDIARLRWLDAQHLRRRSGASLLDVARPWLAAASIPEPAGDESRQVLEDALEAARASAEMLPDLAARVRAVYGWPSGLGDEARAALGEADVRAALGVVAESLREGASLDAALDRAEERARVARKSLLKGLRAALTGSVSGMELARLVPLAERASRAHEGRVESPSARIERALREMGGAP